MRTSFPVVLDKPRNLRFTIPSIYRYEAETGKRFIMAFAVWASMVDNTASFSFLEIVDMLWAGLLHEDRKLTRERAAELLETALARDGSPNVLGEILKSVFKAAHDAMPKVTEDADSAGGEKESEAENPPEEAESEGKAKA